MADHKRETEEMAAAIVTATVAAIKKAIASPAVSGRIAALEARILALEAKPSIQDKGIWRDGKTYSPGDIVTHAGSGWICGATHFSTGTELSHDHFRLFVKRGANGKDAR